VEVSHEVQRSADLPLTEETFYQMNGRKNFDIVMKKKIVFLLLRVEPRFLGHPAHNLSLNWLHFSDR
jgi:hypothetical protein